MKPDNGSNYYWPVAYEVVAGQTYYWCGCGRCDDRIAVHQQKNCMNNSTYKAIVTETVLFCGCGKTKSPPFCDGSHAE